MVLSLAILTEGPASAHTSTIKASCDNLYVKLSSYQRGHAGAQNHITIKIDGRVRVDTSFDTGFDQTIGFGDRTVAHDWEVTVTAWDGPNNPQWSFTKSGRSTPCPDTKVTPAAPVYTPPSCTKPPSLTYSDGKGYTWERSGPDDAVRLKAVAKSGYQLTGQTEYGPYDTTPWTAEEKEQHGCAGKLVTPVVTPSERCEVGASIQPLSSPFITYTITGGSWTNLAEGDYVITATLTGGATEFSNTAGWTVTGNTATYTVHVKAPEKCPDKEVTPAAPTYTPPSCTQAPTLSYSNGEGYTWTRSGPDDAAILTAVATPGYVLTGTTVYGPYDLTPWTLQEKIEHGCTGQLVIPVVVPSARCDVGASIQPLANAFINYAISGGSWTNLGGGDYTITATLTGGATEFADTAGWVVTGTTATFVVHVQPPLTCVTPSAQVSPQVCVPEQPGSVADGSITVGTEPGVTYVVRDSGGATVTPSALAAGTYTVTATAQSGYEVVDGNGFVDGVLTLEVLPPETDCTVETPVEPTVRAIDECFTVNDRVDFVKDNDYWTAEITDTSHVTFSAKDGYYFLDEADAKVKQLVLEYEPLTDEDCPLVPGDVGATCVGNVPYLAYDLDLPEGFETDDPRPLTITFVNPNGPDYSVDNLPLSGRMLWPGASATPPLMWPGWDLVNGEYVDVGDKRFGWTRDGVTVEFDVNPHYETLLTYPPASVACANPPSSPPPDSPPDTPPGVNRTPPTLPNTGGPSAWLAAAGSLLMLAGVALVRRTARGR